MKILRILAVLMLCGYGAKAQDTLDLSAQQMADTIYGDLVTHINTGFLVNRTLVDTSLVFALHANQKSQYTANADLYFRLMHELKLMAIDTTLIEDLFDIYQEASIYVAGFEFNEDRYVYPIGIIDYNFNELDVSYGQLNNLLTANGLSYQDVSTTDSSAYSTKNCTLIAPLHDYIGVDDISLIFRKQDFRSNYRDTSEIQQLEFAQNGVWTTVNWNQEYNLSLSQSDRQFFDVRITYTDSTTIMNNVFINSPEMAIKPLGVKSSDICQKKEKIELSNISIGKTILEYCMIPGCNNYTTRPQKPYILVTGFRPPIVEQSFDKTWEIYSPQHGNLLENLINNNFDIYLIRFNIHINPQGHGMQESAELFIRFLEMINQQKQIKNNENIIQGSSMGADITRLALLKMEKTHLGDNTYPHHHTRLFVSHDANTFGANIPLAYQYQIYSGIKYMPAPTSTFLGESIYLRFILYATLQQKALKELVQYHAKANDYLFFHPVVTRNITPKHHQKRTDFLDALNNYDNHKYFTPYPASTRNIAISLGRIKGTNNTNTQNLNFIGPGEYWENTWFPGIKKIRTGIYSNSYINLYHREEINITYSFLVPLFYTIRHKVNVKYMKKIDNASGSYIKDLGNIMLMTNYAYTAQPPTTYNNFISGLQNQPLFSHKSVLTALAINPNLWGANGNMTLDMHSLGLMYNTLNFDPINDLSDHYGYPNLGRPNDHFNITPFEAVAVDNELDPHIVLKDSDPSNVNSVTNFILNEVEPWYLGLQNQELGSQARANYIYKARRRAKYNISTGYLVTPKTDPGNYTVNSNAELHLEAGESIDAYPGTTFLNGCEATLIIKYIPCTWGGAKVNYSLSNNTLDKEETPPDEQELSQESFIKKSEIRVFPNPSNGSFTIANMQDVPFDYFEIYDLSGNLVIKQEHINKARYACNSCLTKGIYILHVYSKGILKQKKINIP